MPKVCPVCGATYPDSNAFCPSDGTTLRAADADGDLIGSVVADRYLVTDLLGEGGMGKVYLARHVRLPQQAAIKVLRPEMLKDPAAVARFNREAANACRIEHERVARVFDFGETSDGLVYLAMEYVPGDSLKELLTKHGPLPLERAALIVRQIADGLDAAHRLGIVHRDLKPDNILVTPDEIDGSDRCKVVDFGIAKAMNSKDSGEAGLTRTGFVVGTPEFMSPEQLMGTELDQRSDVYALALVAYQCITCDLPFDTRTPDRGMTARLTGAPRPLQVVKADISWPPTLQAVFDQALARDPAQRTATAGTFAKAFEAAVTAPRFAAAPAAAVPPAPTPVAAAKPTPASAPHVEVDTPGAARQIATVNKSDLPKPARREPAPQKKAAPTPAEPPVVVVKRGFPRFRLPSIGFLLVVGAGWWWYTKQRAPRPADLDKLVNSAVQTADKLASTAQSAAGTVQGAIREVAPSTSDGERRTGQSPAPSAAPATAPPNRNASGSGASAASTGSAGAAAARATLDSITERLDPNDANEDAARAAIPALRALLPRLANATDSTWSYIRIAEAHLLLSEIKPACTALRSAKVTARSMNQAEVITRYTGQLGCAQ